MDRQLGAGVFLAGAVATIADVALYTYTAHAPEGGVTLAPYANIASWLSRVEALEGFIPMRKTPLAA